MTVASSKKAELLIILTLGFLRGCLDETSSAAEIRGVPGYRKLGLDFSDELLEEFLVLAKMARVKTAKAA